MKTSFQDDDQAVPQVKYATSADYFIAKTTDVKEAAPVLVSRHSMQNPECNWFPCSQTIPRDFK